MLTVVAPVVSLDLQAASDTGTSNSDNITSANLPTFDVTVSDAGAIGVDFNGDGTADATRVVNAAGTYAFTPTVALTDGPHTARATFTTPQPATTASVLPITIDTVAPALTAFRGGGSVLQSDGINDLVSVPRGTAISTIESTDKFTVEAWVKVDAFVNTWFSVVDVYNPAGDFGWTIQINQASGLQFASLGGSSSSGYVPPTGVWTHLAVAYDRAAGHIKFFANGNLVKDNAFNVDVPTTAGPMYLFYNPSGADDFSRGSLDDLRLWTTARTDVQIQSTLYQAPSPSETGLGAYFKFDEGAGTVVRDSSSFALNGTLGAGTAQPAWTFSTTPFGAPQYLTAPVTSVSFNFNEPVVASSIALANTVVFGPASSNLQQINGSGSSYAVTIDPLTTVGDYVLGVRAVTDVAGNTAPYTTDRFYVVPETTPPVVTSVTPAGLLNQNVSSLVVRFSEAIRASTFGPEDVRVVGPGGVTFTPSAVTPSAMDPTQFTVSFAAPFSADGKYDVTIGPAITDLFGNAMQPLAIVKEDSFDSAREDWTVFGAPASPVWNAGGFSAIDTGQRQPIWFGIL